MAKNEAPLYKNMVFPDYQHREFPKWVKNSSGELVLVESQKDELAALAELPKAGAAPSELQLERDNLAKRVAELEAEMRKSKEPIVEPEKTPTPEKVPEPVKATTANSSGNLLKGAK